MRCFLPILFLTGIFLMSAVVCGGTTLPDQASLRAWIQEMKLAPRGPFTRIRWFCNDGSVLPPEPYACVERGGGIQHGEWSGRVKLLRENGYLIANVLADIKPEDFLHSDRMEGSLKQILLEKFLISSDDGWIFRFAHRYRGALQAEDETESAYNLLRALVSEEEWRSRNFPVLVEAVRLLPHRHRGAPVTEMRQLSLSIAEQDPGFEKLRIKIHVNPDAEDGERVRAYAAVQGMAELSEDYGRLAAAIDAVYSRQDLGADLLSLAGGFRDPLLVRDLGRQAAGISDQSDPSVRFQAASHVMALFRDSLGQVEDAKTRLGALDLTLDLEGGLFRDGSSLLQGLDRRSRRERLLWLRQSVDALYGSGLLSSRERDAVGESLARLDGPSATLTHYKQELDYLSRVPSWADNRLRFFFAEDVGKLAVIEPLVRNYVHDRLRGSPLLFYAAVLDSLQEDSGRLLGVRHEFFGETVAGGIRGLNAGLARGTLRVGPREREETSWDPEGIYLLPATTAELSPVAGIITAREGNALSHVQLLARNLGIPNVVVDVRLLPRLEARQGRRVVLAVSPGGIVRIAEDGPSWDAVFVGETKPPDLLIRPDLDKLNLGTRRFLPLERLRAADSGRIAGPKAANLGELRRKYPEAVSQGLVIPFGLFREFLEQPVEPGGPSMFHWMRTEYGRLAGLRADSAQREEATREFLARVREWIITADPGPKFRKGLRKAMGKTFGADGSYGLFVRSDTNLEDLPGFTGAGLNLTVPNVVGFDNVLKAIKRVWASPFTERAHGWRQAYMDRPEHVYVSVLLLKSVPADKSGVMVTADLETGDPGGLSVAVNQGVGGAVGGEGAEELRINRQTGSVRLMAQAAEPLMRVLPPEGGVRKVPVKNTGRVLENGEIVQLIALAETLPERFPALRDAEGRPVPADIEFGFYQGRLVLFQIRPFLESARARSSLFLNGLDKGLDARRGRMVALNGIPSEEE